jgi:hypothetical protein
MPRLAGNQVKGFEFIDMGMPYVKFEASSAADTLKLDYPQVAGYFVGASGEVAVITTNNVYIKTATGWVNALEIYINVSGSWKRVSNDKFYVKTLSGQWKA